MQKFLLISVPCLLLGGCSSLVTAWKSDPIQIYSVSHGKKQTKDKTKDVETTVFTLTGERRTAVAMTRREGNLPPQDVFCAESLPDASTAFDASTELPVNLGTLVEPDLKDQEGTAKDSFKTTLMQTFSRTEASEIYRQMGWNTCLAWAQGAIKSETYERFLEKMVDGGLEIMKLSMKSATEKAGQSAGGAGSR